MFQQPFTPTGCRVRPRRPASGSTPVRASITALSSVSSLLQCAALACRTEIIADTPPDFWCVADTLELANSELWRAVEALEGVADTFEPADTPEATHGGNEDTSEGHPEGRNATDDDDDQEEPDDADQDDGAPWGGPIGGPGFVAMI